MKVLWCFVTLLIVGGCAGFFERKVDQRDQTIASLKYELERSHQAQTESLQRAETAEAEAVTLRDSAVALEAEASRHAQIAASATVESARQAALAAQAEAVAKQQAAQASANARLADAARHRERALLEAARATSVEEDIDDEEERRDVEVVGVLNEQANKQALLLAILGTVAGGMRVAGALAGKAA